MKYWEILLYRQQERKRDGLTLPFLIGSQKYLANTYTRQSIEDLILEMTLKNSFESCVRFCLGTQTFIFEIRKTKNSVYFPTVNQNIQQGLSIVSFHKADFGDTVEELIAKMDNDFREEIAKENFSAKSNIYGRAPKWNKFSDEDELFIKECFSTIS